MEARFIFVALLLSIFLPTNVYSDEKIYGVGASISTYLNNPQIYFPINTKNYLFEPSFLVIFNNRKPGANSTTSTNTTKSYDIGLGIFKKSNITNKTILYYGARVGYTVYTDDTSDSNSYSKYSQTGFYIAPTFGAEYFLSLKFSVGLDYSIQYTNLNTKNETVSNGNLSSRNDQTTYIRSTTEIIFRYHF